MEELRTELKNAIQRTNKLLHEHKDELPEYWYFEGQISALLSVLNKTNNGNLSWETDYIKYIADNYPIIDAEACGFADGVE